MKQAIDAMLQKFGDKNPPPPPALFTLPNAQHGDNIHYVQKVFRGAFEVSFYSIYCILHHYPLTTD